MSSFGERFVKLRTSSAFPKLLAMFCGLWLLWNLIPGVPHFDGGEMGRLTLVLSIEASLAASFILEDGGRQTSLLLEVLKRIEGNVSKIDGEVATIERDLEKGQQNA